MSYSKPISPENVKDGTDMALTTGDIRNNGFQWFVIGLKRRIREKLSVIEKGMV